MDKNKDSEDQKTKIYEDFISQQDDLRRLLADALEFLYRKGKTGNWKDIRGHSLAMWALIECGESPNSPLIQAAAEWLSAKTRKENKGISWESEVWDTALSIIALLKSQPKRYNSKISKAKNWLLSMRNNDWNWHYEPWETSLALLAFLESEKEERKLHWVLKSIDWLIELQEKGDVKSEIRGRLISFHYTAFLILVVQKLMEISAKWHNINRSKYLDSVALSSNFLINYVKTKGIWTNECWSNGYILLALTKYHRATNFDFADRVLGNEIINWFIGNKENIKSGEDIEDTALAILGLWSLFLERQVFYKLAEGKDKGIDEETISKACEFDEFKRFTSLVSRAKLNLDEKFIRMKPDGSIVIHISRQNKKILLGIVAAIGVLAGFIANSQTIIDFVKKTIEAILKLFY